jgi:LacI family fructose operon transcriptional repressor
VNSAPDRSRSKTIEEIAAATGFSRTTVRFVINGQADRYRIAAATRAAIAAYVAEHGYTLDHVARSLKLRRSATIGLVVPDLANAYFARLTAEFEELSRACGLMLLTASTREDPARERQAIANLIARGVDGLILAPCVPPAAGLFARRGGDVPAVAVDRAFAGAALPTVVGDNAAMAAALTAALLATGVPSFLCARPDLPSIADRIAGFRAAFAAAGRDDAELHLFRDPAEDSAAAGRRLMLAATTAHGAPPSSFMCSSLLVLEGALAALAGRDGGIPADTMIGTFDHHPLLDLLPNPVHAARQDERAIAATAFARLTAAIDGAAVPTVVEIIPGRLQPQRG